MVEREEKGMQSKSPGEEKDKLYSMPLHWEGPLSIGRKRARGTTCL